MPCIFSRSSFQKNRCALASDVVGWWKLNCHFAAWRSVCRCISNPSRKKTAAESMEPHGSSAGKEIEGEPWQFKGGIFQDWLYAYETAKYHRTRCGCVCVCAYINTLAKKRVFRAFRAVKAAPVILWYFIALGDLLNSGGRYLVLRRDIFNEGGSIFYWGVIEFIEGNVCLLRGDFWMEEGTYFLLRQMNWKERGGHLFYWSKHFIEGNILVREIFLHWNVYFVRREIQMNP